MMKRSLIRLSIWFSLLVFLSSSPSLAFRNSDLVQGPQSPLPDFDLRRGQGLNGRSGPTPAQIRALAALQSQVGMDLRVEYHGDGTLRRLFRYTGPFTPPNLSPPVDVVLDFLRTYGPLFRLDSNDLGNLVLEKNYVTQHSGMIHLLFQQQYRGIKVFEGEIKVTLNRRRQLLSLYSHYVPQISTLLRTPGTVPLLSVVEAVKQAALYAGFDRPFEPVIRLPSRGPDLQTLLDKGPFLSDLEAGLVIFPARDRARLAWKILLEKDSFGWYQILIDAHTGELLHRYNLYRFNQPEGLVFNSDPDDGAQVIQSFIGDPIASPSAWVSGTQTLGNNVQAREDRDGRNGTPGVPASNGDQHFDFPFTNSYEASQCGNSQTDLSAAITNLFWMNNFMHDYLYKLGFDEPAGNFQEDNFNRGGLGNDSVMADAQDGADLNNTIFRNNANFATPPDGRHPRMQIFLFTNPPFRCADGDFDGDIILHEYTHGLTTRLVGGPSNVSTLSGFQSGAMGEGWSDWYAASILGDPVMGEYVTGNAAVGIRSVAYNNSPLTYEDFGNRLGPSTAGAGPVFLPEVHDDGEIWATVLWDLRGALGQSLAEQLVTDSLKLMPGNPSMLDARDAILLADQNNSGGAHQSTIWSVFAKRGMGFSAESGDGDDTILFAAFDTPAAPLTPGTVLFLDDMEKGAQGWTVNGQDGNGGPALWHLSTRRSSCTGAPPCPSTSWYYGREGSGNYNTGARNFGGLRSPTLDLTGAGGAILEFDHFLRTENFLSPISLCCDLGFIRVSSDNFATFTQVSFVFEGTNGFEHEKINLSRFAGKKIQIEFYFDTFDRINNNQEGWYIDNVRVTEIGNSGPVPTPTPTPTPTPPLRIIAESANYDGVGPADLAVWQPSSGTWRISPSSGGSIVQPWGILGDIPTPGDYDGDGKTDLAVWRPGEGNWYILFAAGGFEVISWGVFGDTPVPGDYDGDNKADLAVWRPGEGNWYILFAAGGFRVQSWGVSGDVPVPADYDGDGVTDLAVWRPGEGNWYVLFSSGGLAVQPWGISGDVPAPGDYDGDGLADMTVWRPAEGNWYILFSSGGFVVQQWGISGDIPDPADFTGDRKADITVWRPSEGNWYILSSTGGFKVQTLGAPEDVPVSGSGE